MQGIECKDENKAKLKAEIIGKIIGWLVTVHSRNDRNHRQTGSNNEEGKLLERYHNAINGDD